MKILRISTYNYIGICFVAQLLYNFSAGIKRSLSSLSSIFFVKFECLFNQNTHTLILTCLFFNILFIILYPVISDLKFLLLICSDLANKGADWVFHFRATTHYTSKDHFMLYSAHLPLIQRPQLLLTSLSLSFQPVVLDHKVWLILYIKILAFLKKNC